MEIPSSLFYGKRRPLAKEIPEGSDISDASDSDGSEYNPDRNGRDLMDTSGESSEVEEEVVEDELVEEEVVPRGRKPQIRYPYKDITRDENSARTGPAWNGSLPRAASIREPIEYFRHFLDGELLELITLQSNLYSVQNNPNKPLNMTSKELEQFIGTIFFMSLLKLPRTRLYWNSQYFFRDISSVMNRDRWEAIKKNLHCNDNSTIDPNKIDRLFKIRPVIEHLVNKFREIPKEQMLVVDEQMVPYKGHSSLKQYMPKKPHKWGYKIYVLAGSSGLVYDFEIFTGSISVTPGYPDIGASGNIVLTLCKSVPTNNHLLYIDNWFTSITLLDELAKQKIFCLGTVRSNRLPHCPLLPDKIMKERGRGSFQEIEMLSNGNVFRVVKWFDNRAVVFLTNVLSSRPIGQIRRWDKKKKEHVNIQCPSVVKTYNQFMGGVDLMNSLIGLYRNKIRSKKYYHRLLYHVLDMTVVNCWLLYRRDCKDFGVPARNELSLFEFKQRIAECLLKEGKCTEPKKVGRPSSSSVEADHVAKKSKGHATNPIPQKNIRLDSTGHWPIVKERRGRCKKPGCKASPIFFCNKCNLYLCINAKNNCFYDFHHN